MESEEYYEPTLWQKIEPVLFPIAMLVMNVGLALAGLAALYLLYGVLGGGLAVYDSLPAADKHRQMANLVLGTKALQIGLGAGALGAAIAFVTEETTGYALLGGAALIGLGIPYGCKLTAAGQVASDGITAALGGFVNAAYVPAALGAILIAVDVIRRFKSALEGRTKPLEQEMFTYGAEASAGTRPPRTSLMGKCWEGEFCRDFIRPHCPIFIARKACWREKRGCYCEEDIVASAAQKVQGIQLSMAPDSRYNFANSPQPLGEPAAGTFRRVELSMAQKKERCRNCVIYNGHEQEKYNLLLPVVIVGGIAACVIFSNLLRASVGSILTFAQSFLDRFSFGTSSGPTVAPTALAHPSETVEWIFVGAFTIMIVSKLLQGLEWMCFRAKI